MGLAQGEALCASAGGPRGPGVRTCFADPGVLHIVQKCCFIRNSGEFQTPWLQQQQRACRTVLVTSRALDEVWGVSTPEACLLLSRFVPATALLFAEFRRLRDSLPPADARKFAEGNCERHLQHAEMMSAVRLRVPPASIAPGDLQSCGAKVCSAIGPAHSP